MPKADGKTIQQRFNERYKVDRKTGCWNWTAGLSGKGYAYIWLPIDRPNARHRTDGSTLQAYKVGYILANGLKWEDLDGLELHHTCENNRCVNPAHLERLTPLQHKLKSDNIISRNANKKECKRGHPFTPENTYININGARICRACQQINYLRRKRKLNASLR